MFFNQSTDGRLMQQEREIKALKIRLETLQREMDTLYDETGITPDTLKQLLENDEYFTQEEREEATAAREEIDAHIKRAEALVDDPRKRRLNSFWQR